MNDLGRTSTALSPSETDIFFQLFLAPSRVFSMPAVSKMRTGRAPVPSRGRARSAVAGDARLGAGQQPLVAPEARSTSVDLPAFGRPTTADLEGGGERVWDRKAPSSRRRRRRRRRLSGASFEGPPVPPLVGGVDERRSARSEDRSCLRRARPERPRWAGRGRVTHGLDEARLRRPGLPPWLAATSTVLPDRRSRNVSAKTRSAGSNAGPGVDDEEDRRRPCRRRPFGELSHPPREAFVGRLLRARRCPTTRNRRGPRRALALAEITGDAGLIVDKGEPPGRRAG